MKTAAIIGIGIVCFLAGIGVGAGAAWMIAGRNTVGLADVERKLIAQSSYGEGWTDGYEARRREQGEASGSQDDRSDTGNAIGDDEIDEASNAAQAGD